MIPRHLSRRLLDALRDTPAVLLVGARQVGKTPLARSLIGPSFPADYSTMGDAAILAAATAWAAPCMWRSSIVSKPLIFSCLFPWWERR